MIVKRNFNLVSVFRNVKNEILLTFLTSSFILILVNYNLIKNGLPFSIAGILGSALAIFIAFRNQSSYARWWEARTIWGSIINNSRIFGRQIITNAEQALFLGKVNVEQVNAFKKESINRQIAFAHCLRLHLRKQDNYEELKHLLNYEEYHQLLSKQNKPNFILHKQGCCIKDAMQKEILGAFDNINMEPNLATFSNWQGACERIKNTPLPMNYQYFTKLFLYVFIMILPLCLITDFLKMGLAFLIMPIGFIISFVFAVMNRVGELNEDPFENHITDVPMSSLCNTIERDLKEMLEEDIPEKIQAENGYLF